MGEVVKPVFGARATRGPVPTVPASAVSTSEEEKVRNLAETLNIDMLYVRGGSPDLERVQKAIDAGETITDYIFSMAGFVKKDVSVDLRRGALESTPLETLCSYLLESGEHQWNTQPHYIGAIILEMNQRLKQVQYLCPDIQVPQFKD